MKLIILYVTLVYLMVDNNCHSGNSGSKFKDLFKLSNFSNHNISFY